jgi:hypothetical protein
MTIYALMGDDMRLLVTVKSADEAFYAITFAALIIFAIEVIV